MSSFVVLVVSAIPAVSQKLSIRVANRIESNRRYIHTSHKHPTTRLPKYEARAGI
jgi:hypothetical protein